MPITAAQLQDRFGIPNIVSIHEGRGGLALITVTTPVAETHLYTHGAHVTHFQPAGHKPVLWMSGQSLYSPSKAIRGGVPLIFPWFGPKTDDAKAPMHGFARTSEWEVESILQEKGDVIVSLGLGSSPATQSLWPHDFRLRFDVRVGSTLELSLTVNNTSTAAFDFEDALHTYFTVRDVKQLAVTGLEATAYIDKTDALKQKPQGNEPVTITAETDRVYLATKSTCVIHYPEMNRRIVIEKEGSDETVVWNPWIAKSKAMADFGDDEWPGMICVETVNAGPHRVKVNTGHSHTTVARIKVEKT